MALWGKSPYAFTSADIQQLESFLCHNIDLKGRALYNTELRNSRYFLSLPNIGGIELSRENALVLTNKNGNKSAQLTHEGGLLLTYSGTLYTVSVDEVDLGNGVKKYLYLG